ncbi:MAG: class I SAM-dependent methyltransferase, partial [Gaiellaceae bacterium]
VQLRRTLSKRATDPGAGARLLVGRVASALPGRGGSVLCIGCRNRVELDRFREHGVPNVTGIDLFSTDPSVRVMDMHAMDFPSDRFDAVYSSHSLEHSYDLGRVVAEIVRVARDGAVIGVEVPVRIRAHEADRIEFSGLDELRNTFRPHLREELWAEEQPARSETNEQGTEIARLVFRLRKQPAPIPVRFVARGSRPRALLPLRIAVAASLAATTLAWLAKALALNDYDPI